MANFYEDIRDGSVLRILTDKGLTMTIRKRTTTFNENTGAVTGEADVDHTTKGIIFPQETGYRADASGAEKNVKTLLLAASGLTVSPEAGDIIVFQSQEHIVIDSQAIGPGGIDVVYQTRVSY